MNEKTETFNGWGVPQTLHTAIRVLAANDPDRASVLNGVGFNGRDGQFGHAMAEKDFNDLTPNMAHAMKKIVTTYRTQLARAGIDVDAIDMSMVGQSEAQPRAQRQQQPTIALDLSGNTLVYRAPYGHPATDIVRALPRRTCGGKETGWAWTIGLYPENVTRLRELFRAGVQFSNEAVAALKVLSQPRSAEKEEAGTPAPSAPSAPQQPSPATQESTGMVRVAYFVDHDSNDVTYKLKMLPSGVIMHGHQFQTARAAQAAADAINARMRMQKIELS